MSNDISKSDPVPVSDAMYALAWLNGWLDGAGVQGARLPVFMSPSAVGVFVEGPDRYYAVAYGRVDPRDAPLPSNVVLVVSEDAMTRLEDADWVKAWREWCATAVDGGPSPSQPRVWP